jgi:amino acid transporter
MLPPSGNVTSFQENKRWELEMTKTDPNHEDARLRELGYQPQFDRALGLFGDFSLGYSYMSPIAGFYALFGYALTSAGPSFFWTMPIVLIGHTLVALVFAEAASQYPIAGGVYQWARRLAGAKFGFLTGWMYLLALIGTTAGLAAGVAPYLGPLLGIESGPVFNAAAGIAMVLIAAAFNLIGTKTLGRVTELGVWAGLVGLLVCGVYLLLFSRVQPISVLWESFGAGDGNRTAALFAASLIGIWIFFGHESCGDLAEEVKDASVKVPRAMILTMVAGGISALIIALGMILAVPDMPAAVSGQAGNIAEVVLTNAFGSFGAKAMLICLLLVVLSATVSVVASASRLLFSLGRDNLIFGSSMMSKIDEKRGLPVAAVLLATLVPCFVVFCGLFVPDAATAIISFATAGIYTAFTMVVLAAVVARMGGWTPAGPFKLGAWGWPITIAGLIFEVLAVINIVWPRPASPDTSLLMTYLIPIVLFVVFLLGLVQLGKPELQEKVRA